MKVLSLKKIGVKFFWCFCVLAIAGATYAHALTCTYDGCFGGTATPTPAPIACPVNPSASISTEFTSSSAIKLLSRTRLSDSSAADDNTPCVEGPACDEYMIACDAPDNSGVIRRPREEGLEVTCTLALDAATCEKLHISHGDGPYTPGEVKNKLQPLLPPKPLGAGGAASIDMYCLLIAHELGAHGTGKSCPNCKEEGEGYAAQKACIQTQLQNYCGGATPAKLSYGSSSGGQVQTSECDLLRGALKGLDGAIGFQGCLCQAGKTCTQCEEACKSGGASSEWCHSLACQYCPPT